MALRFSSLLLALLVWSLASWNPLAFADEAMPVEEVRIQTAGGQEHSFMVELATNTAQRMRGLMHREDLADDAGMLFIYDDTREVSMWMRNTLISLDMLFIDEKGQIVRIAKRTTPLSEKTIRSGRPVKAVLEIKGGRSEMLGIRIGDRVLHQSLAGG